MPKDCTAEILGSEELTASLFNCLLLRVLFTAALSEETSRKGIENIMKWEATEELRSHLYRIHSSTRQWEMVQYCKDA